MKVCVDELVARLEAEACRRKITKKALAEMAGVHPNSLRSFRGHGFRGVATPWSPTLAVLRKVETALFQVKKSPRRRATPQPKDNITHADGEAAI